MKLRSFLTVAAVVPLVFAMGLLLVPEWLAVMYGIETSASAILMARLYGGALLAVGLTTWLCRDFTGVVLRPVIFGSLAAEIASLIVVLVGMLSGTMNSFGWSAVVIYAAGGFGFVYYQFMGSSRR
jgi:hypothetical protein